MGAFKDMTKSNLIEILSAKQPLLNDRDFELAVRQIIKQISESLSIGMRIEIRDFGSFTLHHRPPRVGRNPKSGESVHLDEKFVPYFKPGKGLRDRVNHAARLLK